MSEVPLYGRTSVATPPQDPGERTYRGYSRVRTRTTVGSYGRTMPKSIGPPQK